MVKYLGGKLTRDFKNFRQPPLIEADFRGRRSIIDGDYKLVVQETAEGNDKARGYSTSTLIQPSRRILLTIMR